LTELNWLEITGFNYGYQKGDAGGQLKIYFNDNVTYMVGGKIEVYRVAVQVDGSLKEDDTNVTNWLTITDFTDTDCTWDLLLTVFVCTNITCFDK